MRSAFSVSAQQAEVGEGVKKAETDVEDEQTKQKQKQPQAVGVTPRLVEPQLNVQSKKLPKEYGGQWLSCTTRHVRIFAAYIDPETCEFDETQMDKLALIIDPTDEFVWTEETCTRVYSYFQELVDHYEEVAVWRRDQIQHGWSSVELQHAETSCRHNGQLPDAY